MKDTILHVDFYQIDEAKPIVMEVPVQLEGLAEGVKAGGKLALQMRKIKVKALYNVIPEKLIVNVSHLGLGKTVKVGELSFEGLELISAKEAVVCEVSERTVVVLNVGNIIDMSWVEKYRPQAVLYVWQGGQEGGNGVADVLTGKVCACGKLTDTIAADIKDYPSTENFGDPFKNYYKEDIYVGYRYFETFWGCQ